MIPSPGILREKKEKKTLEKAAGRPRPRVQADGDVDACACTVNQTLLLRFARSLSGRSQPTVARRRLSVHGSGSRCCLPCRRARRPFPSKPEARAARQTTRGLLARAAPTPPNLRWSTKAAGRARPSVVRRSTTAPGKDRHQARRGLIWGEPNTQTNLQSRKRRLRRGQALR